MKKKITAALAGLMMMGGATAFAAIPGAEIAIGGVRPGMSIDEAIALYGQPTYRDGGEEAYFSNGLSVDTQKWAPGVIDEVKLSRPDSGLTTPAGIAIGSQESAITQAYGQPDKMKYDDGANKYTYYASDSAMKLKLEVVRGAVVKIKCELDD